METTDDDVVEIHPREEPTRRTGRSIAIAAGVCVVLLIIAVTTYSIRSDGGGPDRPDPSPPDQYFAIDRMDELTSAPIGHLAGRQLHYLRLANDGSAGFGICGGDGVLHFIVEDGIVSRTKTTSEECYNGFDMTHDLRTLVSQLASAPSTGLVEVKIDSHNRLTPLITVTRDRKPTTYGIDAIAVGPTQTNVGNPKRQAYAVDRLRAASGINTVYAVCAWLDTNTISITGATAEAVAPVQTWEYVGTPVLTREYAAETKGIELPSSDLGPYLPPSPAVAGVLGGALTTGLCLDGFMHSQGAPVLAYYLGSLDESARPSDPMLDHGDPVVASVDGALITGG